MPLRSEDLLLTYKEAADIEVNHAEPGELLIEVPEANGQVTALPFGKCSVEQMRRALQRKRKPASTRPLPTRRWCWPSSTARR
ncbi:MAG: hypothetical protein JXB05_21215 [Myxococcaceae bacterium]|nr:hypothetical protein [Myxococcaceae bacterium]